MSYRNKVLIEVGRDGRRSWAYAIEQQAGRERWVVFRAGADYRLMDNVDDLDSDANHRLEIDPGEDYLHRLANKLEKEGWKPTGYRIALSRLEDRRWDLRVTAPGERPIPLEQLPVATVGIEGTRPTGDRVEVTNRSFSSETEAVAFGKKVVDLAADRAQAVPPLR